MVLLFRLMVDTSLKKGVNDLTKNVEVTNIVDDEMASARNNTVHVEKGVP